MLMKGPGSRSHFAPEVFGTPFDCQAIFPSPLAIRRARRNLRRRLFVCWSRLSLTDPAVTKQSPDGARHLRRQCDNGDIGMAARQQPSHPGSNCHVGLCQQGHGRSRALNQHLAQVSAAALGDPHQPWSAAGRDLARHQPQPCSKVAPLPECRGIADRSHEGGRVQRPDAGNGCQAPGPLIGSGHGRKLGVEGSNPAIQIVPSRAHVPQQESHARAQFTRAGVQQVSEQAAQPGMALRDGMSAFQ